METFEISFYKAKKSRKSSFEVILRGQPAFYDRWYARYRFWAILGLLDPV